MPAYWSSKFQLKPGTWVFVPSAEGIGVGRLIKSSIRSRWTPPDNYFHLRNGGHLAAIRLHESNLFFGRLDIRNFFGSINRSRVTRALKRFFEYQSARDWAFASTVPDPNFVREEGKSHFCLPFGFVQSPLIASLCLYYSALGRSIRDLEKTGISITVYVDDILVSGPSLAMVDDAMVSLSHAAERSDFELNEEKREGPSQGVTAFNIDLSHKSTFIEPARLELFIESYAAAETEAQRSGIRGYVYSVNPAQGQVLG